MTRSHMFFTILAGLHLILVVGGAIKKPILPREHPANDALRLYGAVSGSDSNYGFFAPAVGPQFRAVFVLTDADGNTRTVDPTAGLNVEARLRAVCTTSLIAQPETSEETRKGVLASWAAYVFSQHPDAVQVMIRVEVYEPPTMEQFQQGQPLQWKMVEEYGPFTRDASATNGITK